MSLEVPTCSGCRHHEVGVIFTLCKHPDSKYSIGGKVDFHTTAHMKNEHRGPCRTNVLFSKAIS